MATSGSKQINVVNGFKLLFQWETSSQSVVNNTSSLAWKLKLINNNYDIYDSSDTGSLYWRVVIDGEEFDGERTVSLSNYSVTLKSGTATVEHDTDGTKTFEYYFGITLYDPSGNYSASTTGEAELDQILRASSLTAANGTLGTAQTLTITPQDTSYKHKIKYTCGSASGYAAGSSSAYASGTSISWTPPLTLATQNTTGTSVAVTLKLITYTSDGTELGSASKTITCSIPSSVKPTLSLAVSDATDNFSTFGKYVQGRSKLKIELTAAGSQGSTIAAYKTTADGNSYTTATVETDALKNNGTLTISATVTDSRGRTATASQTISVYEYASPTLDHITVQRCDSDGTPNNSGSYLSVTFSAKIASLDSQNTATYTLLYKKVTATSYTTQLVSAYSNQYSVTNGVAIFAADAASSYDVVLKATDYFATVQRSAVGSSISKLFSILNQGKGIALGKIAEEEDVFDVNFQTYLRGGLKQPTLADNADLDEITIPNTYNGRSGGGYSNCPVDADFTLVVMTASDGSVIAQHLTTCTKAAPEVYCRFYSSSAWGSWTSACVPQRSYSTATSANDLYNTGIYNVTNGALTDGPTSYAYGQILTMAYRKHGGNSSADYASQLYMHNNASTTGNGLYYRTAASNTWQPWQVVAHGAASTAVGSSSIPVYMDSKGEVKACSGVGVLASDAMKVVTTAVTSGEIAASSYLSSQTATLTAVDGYTPVAVTGVQSNSSWVNVYAYWLNASDNTKVGYSIRNYNTSAVAPKITFHVLYVRTS